MMTDLENTPRRNEDGSIDIHFYKTRAQHCRSAQAYSVTDALKRVLATLLAAFHPFQNRPLA